MAKKKKKKHLIKINIKLGHCWKAFWWGGWEL